MKRIRGFLLLALAALSASGCLVVEKKTMVMVIPEQSDKVHLYYVFEGMSSSSGGNIESAWRGLDRLKDDDFSFFVGGGDKTKKDNPLLKHCAFEKIRFFTDPERKRSLCADRRMTILKRKEFEKALNESLSDEMFSVLRGDEQAFRERIKELNDSLKNRNVQEAAKLGGWGPLVKTAEGLLDIFAELDGPSIKALKTAAKGDEFRWLRFEVDSVKLVFPVTPEYAKRVAASPKAKEWLKEMRVFVEPIELLAEDAGLVILIGKKGQAIHLTYVNNTEHDGRRLVEQAVADHVGSPKALILNGKPANAARLIEQFIAEKKP